MGELARAYDAILEATPTPAALWGVHLDTREATETRETFFEEVKRHLEQRLSALAIYECMRIERVAPEHDQWGKGEISDLLTIDGASPLAYAHQTTEDEKKVIRFGVMPIDRVGEQLLAAIEEADEALGRAFFSS